MMTMFVIVMRDTAGPMLLEGNLRVHPGHVLDLTGRSIFQFQSYCPQDFLAVKNLVGFFILEIEP